MCRGRGLIGLQRCAAVSIVTNINPDLSPQSRGVNFVRPKPYDARTWTESGLRSVELAPPLPPLAHGSKPYNVTNMI